MNYLDSIFYELNQYPESIAMMTDSLREHKERVNRVIAEVSSSVQQMNKDSESLLQSQRDKDGVPTPTLKDMFILPAIVAATVVVIILSVLL